ncbi:fatty-acyl-CoA synthase [Nitrobacteraceae bacterium AZCC 1564]
MELPLTPLDFARRARKLYGDREAVVDGGLRLTYTEFFERCDRWSAALQELGVRRGDRVAIISPNTHAMLECCYAVPQIGAVMVPINYRLTADDFAYLIQHSGARVVCAHADYLQAIDGIRAQLPDVTHLVALEGSQAGWLEYESLLSMAKTSFEQPEIAESDLISINYTSGTTSRPKGVMITHRNAWVNSVGTLVHHPMISEDRYLWTPPMFHANGWTFVWTVTAVGATHVCLRKVDAVAAYDLINGESISMLCAAPTVLIALANGPEAQRRRVRRGLRVLTAGAPPAAATIQRIEGELGWWITQVYGLTETAPFIGICEARPQDKYLTSEALARHKARQGVELITSGELKVVDARGKEVAHDGETLGEIVAKGNVVMQGYYKDAAATEEAFRDGWFHSGDAAVVHPDGYVEIRDRYKDVIISGGENVSSIEIEGVLLHHPAVLEAAVVGVPHEKWGETPKAFVVPQPDANLGETELREYCRSCLAGFKVPHEFALVTELPKNAAGKIQKFVLRTGASAISAQ